MLIISLVIHINLYSLIIVICWSYISQDSVAIR